MKRFNLIFLVLILMQINNVNAGNLRKCTLLPVTDGVSGAIGIKVFQEVENYLKGKNGCRYISPAGMLSVFSKFRDKLASYLQNDEVIKAVAEKLDVGSVLRVHIENQIDSVLLKMEVIDDSGANLLFSEKLIIQSVDPLVISQSVKSWVDLFIKEIPYDGLVISNLGDQITINLGKNDNIKIGQKFSIRKKTGAKKHPLLKKIVEWDTLLVAEGRVFNVSEGQALGLIKIYRSNEKINVNDWVLIDPVMPEQILTQERFDEEKNNYNLGVLSAYFDYAQSNLNSTTTAGNSIDSGGTYGATVRGEAWFTRNWIGLLEFGKGIGSLSYQSGSLGNNSVDINKTVFKLMGGYRFLPLGFFYGPQIDFYGGYGSYTYSMPVNQTYGQGDIGVKGILVGVRLNLPLVKDYRVFAKTESMPFLAEPVDDQNVYGAKKIGNSILVEVGGQYLYSNVISIDASIGLLSNMGKFNGGGESFTYKETTFRLGAGYTF